MRVSHISATLGHWLLVACILDIGFIASRFFFLHEILVVRCNCHEEKMRTSSSFIKVHSMFSWYDYVATCIHSYCLWSFRFMVLSYIELYSFHVTFIFLNFCSTSSTRIRDARHFVA